MLSRHWQNGQTEEGGFTLVELLVVIVILGILAAIVVFAVGGITDKGQQSATGIDATNLQVAEEAFFANGKPAGAYTTETNLLQTSYLRSSSTNNYICLAPPVNGAIPDYFVLAAPLPGPDQVSADAVCRSSVPSDKSPGSWTASEGIPAVP